MKLIRFDSVSQYYQRVESYLLRDEAVNCLLLASCQSLSNSDRHELPYLALVEEDRVILATARQIGDRKLFLSKSTNLEAVRLIAKDLAVDSRSIPGITAPQPEAETFVAAWQSLTGQSIELEDMQLPVSLQ